MSNSALTNIGFVLRALIHHGRWIAAGVLLVGLLTVVYVLVIPEVYESNASVLVSRPNYKDDLPVDTGRIDVNTVKDLIGAGTVAERVLDRLRWHLGLLHVLYPDARALNAARENGFSEVVGLSAPELRARAGERHDGPDALFQEFAALEPIHLQGLADIPPSRAARMRVAELRERLRLQSQVINISREFSPKIDIFVREQTGPAAKFLADLWVRTYLDIVDRQVFNASRDVASDIAQLYQSTEQSLQRAELAHATLQNDLLIEVKEKELEASERILFGPSVQPGELPLVQQFNLALTQSRVLGSEITRLNDRINRQMIGTTWIGDATPGIDVSGLARGATGEVARIYEARRRLDDANEALTRFRERSGLSQKAETLKSLQVLMATSAIDIYHANLKHSGASVALEDLASRAAAPGGEGPTTKLRRSMSPEMLLALRLGQPAGAAPNEGAFTLMEEELDPAYRSLRDGVGRLLVAKEEARGASTTLNLARTGMERDFVRLDAEVTSLLQDDDLYRYSAESAAENLGRFREQFNDDLRQLALKERDLQRLEEEVVTLQETVNDTLGKIEQGRQAINQANIALASSERSLASFEETLVSIQPLMDGARTTLQLPQGDVRAGPAASLPDRRLAPRRGQTVVGAMVASTILFSLIAVLGRFVAEHRDELLVGEER